MNIRHLTALLLLAACTCLGGANVFDFPNLHERHQRLLGTVEAAHARRDYTAMERACREGEGLGTADELWAYNLACALALQGKSAEALKALDRAIDGGFRDPDFLLQDADFAALRDTDGFKARLARMAARGAGGERGAPLGPPVVALPPDATHTVMQTASNTLWSFQMGIFHAFIGREKPGGAPEGRYEGPRADLLRTWMREGSASGFAGLLYANRDNGTQPLDVARYPGLLRLAYSPDMVSRNLHIGLPNSLFMVDGGQALLPVIGHSSMGYLNSPYWRSQPRAVCGDPRQTALQSVFLLGNQLHLYPAYADYSAKGGDLFPANTPYWLAVAGDNNAEQPFLAAALEALAALRPETRAELCRTGLLMPTLQRLFRASQRTVKGRGEYLSGLAHPPVFEAANLDAERLVRMAHDLTTNDILPIVVLSLRRETAAVPDRDYFDAVRSEQLFDSPMAVARVFRGAARTRTFEVAAHCRRPDAALRWVLLQGDPSRVWITPCPTNDRLATITVAHHEPFLTPTGAGKRLRTSRVDVGVFAETPAGLSLPSFFSVSFLGNERRTYAGDGRILSIDYTRRQPGYSDPLMSSARNWKDTYQYDAHTNLTGWVRTRGLVDEPFTSYGHRIVATDALGRAARAHLVRYVLRRVKADNDGEGLPDLAQVDDNVEVTYRYASDDDRVGAPDLATLRQDLAPPADE